MKVKFWGTRGSVPIANKESIESGGNTTCIEVRSECLPENWSLLVDAGSGMVPFSWDAMKNGLDMKRLIILYTHYHHDHTQGLLLSPLCFNKNVRIDLYGPIDHGMGPKEMMERIMEPPVFPVSYKEVRSHFNEKGIEFPNIKIFVIHPKGGIKQLSIDEFEGFEKEGKMIPFDSKAKYPLSESLVIKMHRSNHPEQTISYRFEERTTGKVFTFLTDHENQDVPPSSLREHCRNSDLLVCDSQYSRAKYELFCAGFGHGTPDYCIRLAEKVGAKKLGLTHHDPASTDTNISLIKDEAEKASKSGLEIFACYDYQEVEL